MTASPATTGHLAEAVGRSAGTDGNLAGDELVTLDPADTAGRRAALVVEVKDRKLRRKLFAELAASRIPTETPWSSCGPMITRSTSRG